MRETCAKPKVKMSEPPYEAAKKQREQAQCAHAKLVRKIMRANAR